MQLPPRKLEAPPRTLGVDTNYLVEVCGLRKQRPCEEGGRALAGGRSAAAGGVVGVHEQSSGVGAGDDSPSGEGGEREAVTGRARGRCIQRIGEAETGRYNTWWRTGGKELRYQLWKVLIRFGDGARPQTHR